MVSTKLSYLLVLANIFLLFFSFLDVGGGDSSYSSNSQDIFLSGEVSLGLDL
jgi:hypothetical protein